MTLLSTGTEARLVHGAREGAADCAMGLVRHYFPRVESRLRWLAKDAELASDLAQDTFLQAFRDLPRTAPVERFGAWLMTIAWRTYRAWLRSAPGRVARLSTATDPEVLDRMPVAAEDPTALSAERSAVWRLVDRVPEPYRLTLIQRYREDRTVPQIAALQGIGLSLAKFRLRRGEKIVRALMGPRSLKRR